MGDTSGNLEPSIDIYPDQAAPIVRNTSDGRELARVRWGLPSSQYAQLQATKKRAAKIEEKRGAKLDDGEFADLLRMEPDRGTTNVRNTDSRHWKRWLGVEHRCVVPFTSFAEPDPASKTDGRTPNAWFALDDSRPLAFFAGIWVPQWESVRKVKTGLETIDLYGFLTTEPNGVVQPVHQKAMPVILTTPDELETWLTVPWEKACKLQRPLLNTDLKVVPQRD